MTNEIIGFESQLEDFVTLKYIVQLLKSIAIPDSHMLCGQVWLR